MVTTPQDRERAPRALVVSRRAAWVLIALCAWTLYVWITRLFIMAGQDESTGFKVVHGILAAISIAFGLAAGWIGYRALRPDRGIRN
jgi:hypothetical protein